MPSFLISEYRATQRRTNRQIDYLKRLSQAISGRKSEVNFDHQMCNWSGKVSLLGTLAIDRATE